MSYDFTKATKKQKKAIEKSLHEYIEPMCAGIVGSGFLNKGEQIIKVSADVTSIWINGSEWHFTIEGFKQLKKDEIDIIADSISNDTNTLENERGLR